MKDLFFTLGKDDLSKIHIRMDALFAIHMNSKGHTGDGMLLGYGVIFPKSIKQKLNAKSSTEFELIRASDYLPNMIWARMFFDARSITQNEGIFTRTT